MYEVPLTRVDVNPFTVKCVYEIPFKRVSVHHTLQGSRRDQEEGGGAGPSREPRRNQEQGGGAGPRKLDLSFASLVPSTTAVLRTLSL